LTPSSPPGLDGLLFGDLLGVTRGDLAASGALAALCLGALAALHRPLLAIGFDRGSAPSLGARPLLVDLSLLALIAAAIVVGVQGLGNLLVLAVLIGPAATARLLARRVPRMMLVATVVAVVSADHRARHPLARRKRGPPALDHDAEDARREGRLRRPDALHDRGRGGLPHRPREADPGRRPRQDDDASDRRDGWLRRPRRRR